MGLYLGTSKFTIVNHTPSIVKNVTESLERAETALNTYAPTILTITTSIDGITSKYYIESGSKLTIQEPSKDGYKFNGWYLNDTLIDLNTYTFNENTYIIGSLSLVEDSNMEFLKTVNYKDFKISGDSIESYGYIGSNKIVNVPGSYSLDSKPTYFYGALISNKEEFELSLGSDYTSITIVNEKGDESTYFAETLLDYIEEFESLYIKELVVEDGYYVGSMLAPYFTYPLKCNSREFADAMELEEYCMHLFGESTFTFDSYQGASYTYVAGTDYKITTLNDDAFSNDTNITKVVLGEGIVNINGSIIRNSVNVTSIHIPSTTTNIDKQIFYNAEGLTVVTIAEGNTVYDSRDNCNAIIETSTNTLIAGCAGTIIPKSVMHIGSSAFCDLESVPTIEIPEGILTIGSNAFSGCDNIIEVIIPSTVTSIGTYAFNWCTGLTSATIKGNIAEFAPKLFQGCKALRTLTLHSKVPPTFSDSTSLPTTVTKIHIPVGTKDAYKAAANWSKFSSKFVDDVVV